MKNQITINKVSKGVFEIQLENIKFLISDASEEVVNRAQNWPIGDRRAKFPKSIVIDCNIYVSEMLNVTDPTQKYRMEVNGNFGKGFYFVSSGEFFISQETFLEYKEKGITCISKKNKKTYKI